MGPLGLWFDCIKMLDELRFSYWAKSLGGKQSFMLKNQCKKIFLSDNIRSNLIKM